MPKRATVRRGARALAILTSVSLAVGFAASTEASAAPKPTFHAAGSVEPGVRHRTHAQRPDVAPQRPRARPSRPRSADALGGLLFRNVRAGQGLPRPPSLGRAQVGGAHRALRRGGAVESGRLQPVDSVATATGTSPRATGRSSPIDVHPPTSPAGEPGPPGGHAGSEWARVRAAVPDADRILGLRLRRPGRSDRAASPCSRT